MSDSFFPFRSVPPLPAEYLTARQRACETALKHIGTGTVAVVMFLCLALLTAVRGNSDAPAVTAKKNPELYLPSLGQAELFSGVKLSLEDFRNKCAADR